MTQEDKNLLLKDLSARLIYGVFVKDIKQHTRICKIYETNPIRAYCLGLIPFSDSYYYQEYSCDIDSVRPYLRPMSSMTEQEYIEYSKLWNLQDEFPTDADIRLKVDVFDWLNAHHFDYRGLIERNLALEAPEGIYN